MTKLKPCPFCGSNAHIQESIDKGWPKRYHAVCDDRKCKCPMVTGMPLWRGTREQAEKDWNTRASTERVKNIIPLEEIDITVRAYNCLKRSGINTLNELSDYSEQELMKVRNLGPKCYEEVIELCKQYGISLKGAKE